MKILFRADGNKNIGWGHVIRSLSIASEARNMGAECFFVCADNSLKRKIEEYEFNVIILNSDYTKMTDELRSLIEIINAEKPDFIFVDSYYVTNEYFEELKKYSKIVYIDDLFAFPYNVDFLLNYNIYASKTKYLKLYKDNDIPELLLGLRYVPLRSEFKNIHKSYNDNVENVFVSTGGSDEYGLVLRLIKGIYRDKSVSKDINYHFVIGGYEPDRDEIYKMSEADSHINAYYNVHNVSELMNKCDIAISAAGSTLYELCTCGVPTITYTFADNQVYGANCFSELGLMINAGDLRENNYDVIRIIDLLKILLRDNSLRRELYDNMNSLFDSNGANNIVKIILQY